MATEIFMKRTGSRLVPYSSSDVDKIKSLELDQILKVKVSRPRNIGHHQKFFALLQMVFENQDHYTSIETMRKIMVMQAGFYDTVKTQKGEVMYFPQSISFQAMDQEAFGKFYERFLDVAMEMIGLDSDEISKELTQFM